MERLSAELVVALSPQSTPTAEGGRAYLEHLLPTKEHLDQLYARTVQEGRGLVQIFSKPPLDPQSPMGRINEDLACLHKEKQLVDRKWEEAWHPAISQRSDPVGQSPSHSSKRDVAPAPREEGSKVAGESGKGVTVKQVQSTTTGSSKVRKVSQVGAVSKQNSDKYSELEEEAYEVKGRHTHKMGGAWPGFRGCGIEEGVSLVWHLL